MKTLIDVVCMVFVVCSTLHFSWNAALSTDMRIKKHGLTSHPITNESVEAGLRKNREALRASPEFQANDTPTHLQLAEVLSQQGDPNGAIEEYLAVIHLDPLLGEAYRELGAVYIDKHNWQKAEQALRKGVELNSQDHQSLYWLGRSLLAQERFYQASEALLAAKEFDPNNPEIHSDLGLTLMAQGQIQEAMKSLKKAISLQPDFADAHHRLEQVRAAKNDSDQLIQAARRILHILFRRE